MDDSFEGDKEKDDNKLFREERNLYSKRGIYSYPSVIINGMTFRVKITMFCWLVGEFGWGLHQRGYLLGLPGLARSMLWVDKSRWGKYSY